MCVFSQEQCLQKHLKAMRFCLAIVKNCYIIFCANQKKIIKKRFQIVKIGVIKIYQLLKLLKKRSNKGFFKYKFVTVVIVFKCTQKCFKQNTVICIYLNQFLKLYFI